MFELIGEVAEQEGIPHQFGASAGSTWTDADAVKLTRGRHPGRSRQRPQPLHALAERDRRPGRPRADRGPGGGGGPAARRRPRPRLSRERRTIVAVRRLLTIVAVVAATAAVIGVVVYGRMHASLLDVPQATPIRAANRKPAPALAGHDAHRPPVSLRAYAGKPVVSTSSPAGARRAARGAAADPGRPQVRRPRPGAGRRRSTTRAGARPGSPTSYGLDAGRSCWTSRRPRRPLRA